MGENAFNDLSILEMTDIVLSVGSEMGYLIIQLKTKKPTVSSVDLDFLNGLTHGTNAEETLQDWNLN